MSDSRDAIARPVEFIGRKTSQDGTMTVRFDEWGTGKDEFEATGIPVECELPAGEMQVVRVAPPIARGLWRVAGFIVSSACDICSERTECPISGYVDSEVE